MKRHAILLILTAAMCFSPPFSNQLRAQERDQERPIEEKEEKPQGQTALRVEVNQVRVDAVVENDDGNLIQGLSKEHFRVYEDKVQQEITYFSPVEAPITAVLITEYSKVIPWEWLYEAWLASHTFLDQMRKGDWVAAVAYDIKPEILTDFTQNKFEVYDALRRLNFPAYRESNLHDAVLDVLDRVEELDQRVALVLITSGLDTFSKKNRDELLDKVKQSNVVIYAVSLGGNFRARYDPYIGDMTRMDLHQADALLRALAKYTGGEAYFPRFVQGYRNIFNNISLMLRNQYSLGYVSSNTKEDGEFRKIKVEVVADIDGDGKPDEFEVRHREGYLAAKN